MDNNVPHNDNSSRAKQAVANSQAHLDSGLTAPLTGNTPAQGVPVNGMKEINTTPAANAPKVKNKGAL